ncbi:MAG: tRNA 2-thiouridine(34) synthase MnmA [Aggregatilineales bacterium]|nr:tRNA 2-thiouridine(34) synthase MnmA [Chloroflexota bacterium]HOA24375.1 tRNA 2-thiouridine(34) synthase MnmA [Aggregatilineales bacterium]HPV05932.1 tRNA 2-thiouridine(34) synthase MnmA [Aggregatilineales bacterium]
MSEKKPKVVVAMSGGVDSSVSAALLLEQGYEVEGIMMRLWSEPGFFTVEGRRDNRCCTRDQMLDAHFVARKLGIKFELIDARDTFKQQIVDRFIEDYSRGITPNPCLNCNRHIRFGFLLNEALARGADYLATGHYARVTRAADGTYELRKGADPHKDQSYVLSVLNQSQLARAMFPVGGYTKQEVRALAEKFGLPVASKHDSQDLCFVADGDYRRFLRHYAADAMQPGPIVRTTGEVLGQHDGLPNYTIGQRKGLGISYAEPLYVLEKHAETNTLVVGTREELGRDHLTVRDMNWIAGMPPAGATRAEVKIRYKARPAAALVRPLGPDRAEVILDEPLPDVTAGQGAVFYDGDRVLGSGIIM